MLAGRYLLSSLEVLGHFVQWQKLFNFFNNFIMLVKQTEI